MENNINMQDNLKQLYELSKDLESLDNLRGEITTLAFKNKTNFFVDLEEFLIRQYTKQSTILIQTELINFILNADYNVVDGECLDEDLETIYTSFLSINSMEFKIGHLDYNFTSKLTNKQLFRDDFEKHTKNECFLRLNAGDCKSIIESTAYEAIFKFNRMNDLDKKFPPKEGFIKKLINKI